MMMIKRENPITTQTVRTNVSEFNCGYKINSMINNAINQLLKS